jgi:2-polyprenyl-3-methyl-5-hydroxy-6-metoxy-1,4-benzoquinol methylase
VSVEDSRLSLDKSSAEIYVFEINEDDDSAAANILRMVGRSKRVLEIGAGPGSISRPLTLRNHCAVTALELDPNCVPILETFCERVVQGDLNGSAWTSELEPGSFDVVVIADVLEHLTNPWRTLKQVAPLLKRDGYVVSSIPNASHCTVLANFANDDVAYRDWGLLDRTHVRFFGVKNVQAMFEQAGLRITRAAYVVRPPELTEFADLWPRLSSEQRRIFEAGPFAQVYQTVVVAEPEHLTHSPPFVLFQNPPKRAALHPYHSLVGPRSRQWIRTFARKVTTPSMRQSIKRVFGLR